jgi:hypothetical protein
MIKKVHKEFSRRVTRISDFLFLIYKYTKVLCIFLLKSNDGLKLKHSYTERGDTFIQAENSESTNQVDCTPKGKVQINHKISFVKNVRSIYERF